MCGLEVWNAGRHSRIFCSDSLPCGSESMTYRASLSPFSVKWPSGGPKVSDFVCLLEYSCQFFLTVCLVVSVSQELCLNSVWSEGMKYRASLSPFFADYTSSRKIDPHLSNFKPKIHPQSSKMGPWSCLGNPWERSWRHFGSQGRPGKQKGDKPWFVGPPWGPQGSPFGNPFFDIFRYFWCFFWVVFSKLCFGGFRALFFMDLGCFLVVFFDVFFCVSGASITKENVVLIQYLLCSKHIYLFEKRRKSI